MPLPPALRRAALATAVAAGLGASCLTAAAPALADPVVPVAAPVVAPVVAGPVAAPAAAPAVQAPTPQEVEEARLAAERSRAEAEAARQRVATAQGELDALAQRANAALERYQTAVEARQLAEQQEREQRDLLARAQQQLAESRTQLGQWAAQAYKDGGSLQEYTGLVTVLESRDTDEVPNLLKSVKRLGQDRSDTLTTYRAAEAAQREAAAKAAAAAVTAREQSEAAAVAKKEADTLVAEQQGKLAELLQLQLTAEGSASSQAGRAAKLAANLAAAQAQAEAAARAAKTSGARSVSGGLVGEVGECTGGPVAGYANGTIPRSSLCPLWGAPQHVLRADAANAFNKLSKAYAEHFGRPMCVTDSYRPLADQISVAARKPGLAAKPGTSRHGLGIAVNLCDGVNRFGSDTFNWLKRNASLYGWLHPAWAEPGGSGPEEAWHWEYTG